MMVFSVLLALVGDRLVGEVTRWHPLVGFGNIANTIEQRARQWAHRSTSSAPTDSAEVNRRLQFAGSVAWAALVLPAAVVLWLLQSVQSEALAMLSGAVVLYFCIGMRSLSEHARAIAKPLIEGDLVAARSQLSRIVSRDTAALEEDEVCAAAVESVLENGSDAVLAPIFWFAVAGAPGVLCYRLSNTLDAMWGYRSARYHFYGRTAARMDDFLNWIPARCCSLSYAMVGRFASALRCWWTQGAMLDSPNAGPVMASGAGALEVRLGGTAVYGGQMHWRPMLGLGRAADVGDIERALQLVWRAIGIWVAVLMAGAWVSW